MSKTQLPNIEIPPFAVEKIDFNASPTAMIGDYVIKPLGDDDNVRIVKNQKTGEVFVVDVIDLIHRAVSAMEVKA